MAIHGLIRPKSGDARRTPKAAAPHLVSSFPNRTRMKDRFRIFIAALLAAAPLTAAPAPLVALVRTSAGSSQTLWITGNDEQNLTVKDQVEATETRRIPRAEIKSLHVFPTAAMAEAQALFANGNYTAARTKFSALREDFKGLAGIDGNPGTEAAFMELECLRKSGDLEALAKALETFDRNGLVRESQRRQLDLYATWDAVRRKDWPKVESAAREYLKDRQLPGGQRVQMAYCLGQALEAQSKPQEAIDSYQIALVADGSACVEIARDSLLHSLRLYRKDAAVLAAMKSQPPDGPGRQRLLEAAALADLWTTLPGSAGSLPADLAEFLKFRPENAPAPRHKP